MQIPVSENAAEPEDEPPEHKPEVEAAPYYNTYNVSLDVSPDTGRVSAIEKIDYRNTTGESLDELFLNVYLNAFTEKCTYIPYSEDTADKIFINGAEYAEFNINSITVNSADVSYSLNNTVLNLKLREPLAPNEDAVITLYFEAYVPEIAHKTGRNANSIWLGNFIPTLSVYDGGRWLKSYYYPTGDSVFADIANYNVAITAPASYAVIAGGQGETVSYGDKNTTTFSIKMVRNFAAAIGRGYSRSSVETSDGVYINLYHTTKNADAVDSLLNNIKASIEYYTKNIGSYPYSQLDIAETDYFTGADAQFSRLALIDASIISSSDEDVFSSLEFGLQWFGAIIGVDKSSESWLAEGPSVFLQSYIAEKNPVVLAESMEAKHDALSEALRYEKHPELENTLAAYETWTSFENVQKRRSELMFYALYRKMGQDKFSKFLIEYCSIYSFKNTASKDMISLAEKIYGGDLSEFFNDWIRGNELPPLE